VYFFKRLTKKRSWCNQLLCGFGDFFHPSPMFGLIPLAMGWAIFTSHCQWGLCTTYMFPISWWYPQISLRRFEQWNIMNTHGLGIHILRTYGNWKPPFFTWQSPEITMAVLSQGLLKLRNSARRFSVAWTQSHGDRCWWITGCWWLLMVVDGCW